MVDKHNSQWYYTELSQIIVLEKQTIKKNFRKMKFAVDKRQKI